MKVLVSRCDVAPASDRWQAMLREYDLGEPVGSGATPLEAIADLLWRLDADDTDPATVDIVWVE